MLCTNVRDNVQAVTPHDWDPAAYDRVASGVKELGHEVMERLVLTGDETVLDAGCGPGEVTAALVARLPRGRVIAVDASPRMVAAARERLGPDVEVLQSDLVNLRLTEPVDAVLSTATFHWVQDHPRLFARLHTVLRPGGRLVAQCGGAGNIAEVHTAASAVAREEPFSAHLAGWPGPWTFATPEATTAELGRAGFTEVRCWTTQRSVTPDDPATYARAVLLGAHLEHLPVALQEPYVEGVLARVTQDGEPLSVNHVRLNIEATAAGA